MINIKVLKGIFIVCVVLITIFSIVFIKDEIKYSKYIPVKAEIIKIETKKGTSSKTSMSRKYIVTYKYIIENEEYTAEKQVFTKSNKTVGDIEEIKYNSNNFLDIENTLLSNTYKAMIVYLIIFSTLLGIIISNKEKEKNT